MAIPNTGKDYVQAGGERCADGAHILFVPVIPMGSIVMRGLMPMLILNQTLGRLHDVRATYLEFNRPTTNANMSSRFDYHVATYGPPSACVILKYPTPSVLSLCRKYGAVTVVDCIDNHRCFSASTMNALREYDATIVQTEEHAAIARSHGVRAAVLPHPHGDHRYERPRPQLNRRLKGVGFVYGDARNMLPIHAQQMICRACLRANLTLYLIYSPSNGMLQPPRAFRCEQHGRSLVKEGLSMQTPCANHLEQWDSECPKPAARRDDDTARTSVLKQLPPLRDWTGQHRFYHSNATRKVLRPCCTT